jgi:hypothetical protein
MRTFQFTLFLFGLLAFFAVSAPVTREGDVAVRDADLLISGEYVGDDGLDKKTVSLANAVGTFKTGDVKIQGLDALTSEDDLSEDQLVTRAPKKKAPKPKKKAPKKKAPKKKAPKKKAPKKKAPKKKAPKPKKTPTKTKSPATKTPTATPKVCPRADANGCGKTANYQVAAEAAKKKGTTMRLGESYLLKVRTGLHKQIVVGKVVKNKKGELDFEAAMSELTKDPGEGSKFVQACKMLHGAKCEENHIESYSCSRMLDRGSSFKFVGAAKPEFADVKKFISDGETLGPFCIHKQSTNNDIRQGYS